MVYLDNNTNQQEVWIPRNDGLGETHKNMYTLEGVNVSISADTTTVTPSSGFYGMSAVTIDASDYAQQNYEGGFEDGYQDGFMSGSSEGFESGYTSGHSQGMADQKALLSTTALTENGSYSRENGWSGVTVNIDTASTWNSGYNSGHTDGVSEEKAKMSAVTFTANTAVTLSDGSYSAVTVDVPQTGYTQQDLDNAFASGETVGENTIIATFSSTTATTNGQYGSTAHPLSAITVNVPQTGSTLKVEVNKPYTAISEGTYTIVPTSYQLVVGEGYKSITFDASQYPDSGDFDLGRIYYNDNRDYYIDILFEYGEIGHSDSHWPNDSDFRKYVSYTGDTIMKIEFEDLTFVYDDVVWVGDEDGYSYDVMSAVTLTVDIKERQFVEYLETNGSQTMFYLGAMLTSTAETVYFDFMPLSGNAQYDGWYTFINADNLGLRTCWGGYAVNGRYGYKFGNFDQFDTWYNGPIFSAGTKYECVFAITGATINGTDYPGMPYEPSIGTPSTITLNGYIGDGIIGRCPIARYYGFKIMSGETVVSNFRPCLDTNGVPCFYETVSETYIYASGSGSTSYGPVLPSEDYMSGYTDGRDSVISTFTAITATTNGVYGSSANPLSSMTVNVPQTGSSAVLGVGSFSANGTYSASTDNLDGYSAITINIQSGSERTELEYLITTGDTWFVLDHQFQASESVEIKKATISNEGFMFEHYSYIDGGGEWWPNNEWPRIGFSDLGMYYSYYEDNKVYLNVTGVTDSTILMTKDGFWIDGVQLTARTFTETAQQPTNMIVFANNQYGGNVVNNQTAKIGKITITDTGGTVVAQYIPCLDSGNTVCFYNPISDTYIYKSVNCNGTPLAGPVAPSADYLSGYTDGQNSIISTFTSMTATTNGVYGSSASPLSSITVNVPAPTYLLFAPNKSIGFSDTVMIGNGTRLKMKFKKNNSGYTGNNASIVCAQQHFQTGYVYGGIAIGKNWIGYLAPSASTNVVTAFTFTDTPQDEWENYSITASTKGSQIILEVERNGVYYVNTFNTSNAFQTSSDAHYFGINYYNATGGDTNYVRLAYDSVESYNISTIGGSDGTLRTGYVFSEIYTFI